MMLRRSWFMLYFYFSRSCTTTYVIGACTGVNVGDIVGEFPKKEGTERKDVMSKNVPLYKSKNGWFGCSGGHPGQGRGTCAAAMTSFVVADRPFRTSMKDHLVGSRPPPCAQADRLGRVITAESTSGQIGYALVPMIARVVMLGADQPAISNKLDIPLGPKDLNGAKMGLVYVVFPLLKGRKAVMS